MTLILFGDPPTQTAGFRMGANAIFVFFFAGLILELNATQRREEMNCCIPIHP